LAVNVDTPYQQSNLVTTAGTPPLTTTGYYYLPVTVSELLFVDRLCLIVWNFVRKIRVIYLFN